EKCMNKFNEIRLLLCGHIHKVRALYFLFIFHFSLDFSKGWAKTP
ncbi:N-acetylmuramoyl-L-alanine amidase, partial [Bacillus thuringiensis]